MGVFAVPPTPVVLTPAHASLVPTWRTGGEGGVGVSDDWVTEICPVWTLKVHAETTEGKQVFVKLGFAHLFLHIVVDIMAMDGQ